MTSSCSAIMSCVPVDRSVSSHTTARPDHDHDNAPTATRLIWPAVTNFGVARLSSKPAAFADVTAALATALGFRHPAGAGPEADVEVVGPLRPRPAPRLWSRSHLTSRSSPQDQLMACGYEGRKVIDRRPPVGLPPCYHDVMKEDRKVLTVRVDSAQAREAEVVARAEGVSVNELVRQALAAHIEARRKDKAFRARIAGIIEEDKAILERLAQ